MSIWLDRAGNMYSVDQNNHTRTKTVVLKRTPEGVVSTLAGGAYGHMDGKGPAAKLSTVGAMVFGADGNLYLSDGEYVRRVSMDGAVTTLAKDLLSRTPEDKPALFGGSYGSLAGLSTEPGGNVYVADAGNRRLLKISRDGKVTVVYRCDPPFFPNGVFATSAGEVYVLEFSFVPPGTWGGPRVRKIAASGTMSLLVSDTTPENRPPASAPVTVLTRATSLSSYRVAILFIVLTAGLIVILLTWANLKKRRRI
jgi:DNA-binding beta-propeller fold protein YncE